jgi:hypothetical protein
MPPLAFGKQHSDGEYDAEADDARLGADLAGDFGAGESWKAARVVER